MEKFNVLDVKTRQSIGLNNISRYVIATNIVGSVIFYAGN